MGIQFPPIAFLYLLYLFIYFFLLLFISLLSCTVVKSIIKLKLTCKVASKHNFMLKISGFD